MDLENARSTPSIFGKAPILTLVAAGVPAGRLFENRLDPWYMVTGTGVPATTLIQVRRRWVWSEATGVAADSNIHSTKPFLT